MPQKVLLGHIVIALSIHPSFALCIRCVSPIYLEVGIPDLVCEYILELGSVAYHFQVTVALTLSSDLVFRIIVTGAYLILFEVGIPNLVFVCILGWQAYHLWVIVTFTLTSDLVSRVRIESGAYLLYSLR